MLTREDLASIKGLLDEQGKWIEGRFTKLENRVQELSERTEERFTKLENGVQELSERTEERLGKLETNVQELSAYAHKKVGEIENSLQNLSDYTHKKFALIENDMIPKISILFETRDLCVQHMEYRKKNEEIERKLAYIDPMMQKIKEHSQMLEQQDKILKMLVNA